jgi:hypothetical protein
VSRRRAWLAGGAVALVLASSAVLLTREPTLRAPEATVLKRQKLGGGNKVLLEPGPGDDVRLLDNGEVRLLDRRLRTRQRWQPAPGGNPILRADGSVAVFTPGGLEVLSATGQRKSYSKFTATLNYWSNVLELDGQGLILDDGNQGLRAFGLDGSQRWYLLTGGEPHGLRWSTVTETLYARSTDGFIYALAPDGTVRWHALGFNVPELVGDGVALVQWDALRVCGADGSERWRVPRRSTGVRAGPDGSLYATFSAEVHRYAADGKLQWRRELGPAYRFVGLLEVGPDGAVYVFKWTSPMLEGPGIVARIRDQAVEPDVEVLALDAGGRVLWHWTAPGYIRESAALGGARLAAICDKPGGGWPPDELLLIGVPEP